MYVRGFRGILSRFPRRLVPGFVQSNSQDNWHAHEHKPNCYAEQMCEILQNTTKGGNKSA